MLMAWIRVESRVALNQRFLQAGPASSWLWICGLAYCQDQSLDGFIPFDAHLCVPDVRKHAARLVSAGLWAEADGGWLIQAEFFSFERRIGLRYLLERLIAFWGRACVYCGAEPKRLEIDHIVPRSRGGTDRRSNLTLACQPCNRRKSAKTAAEFGHPHIHEQAKGLQ